MSNVHTELFKDTFQRPNEAPLSVSTWTQNTDILNTSQLQVVGGQCAMYDPLATGNTGLEFPNVTMPPDSYCQAIAGAFDGVHEAQILLALRATVDGRNGYFFSIFWTTGAGDGELDLYSYVNGVYTQLGVVKGLNVKQGDIFLQECITEGSGCRCNFYQNGALVLSLLDSHPLKSGLAALGIFDFSLASGGPIAFKVTQFTAGSVVSSSSGGGDHISIDFKNWMKALFNRRFQHVMSKNVAQRKVKETRIMGA